MQTQPRHIARPRSPPIEVVVRYLDDVRDRTGLTLTAIARKAGIDPSTLTQPMKRFADHDETVAVRNISLATLRRIAAAVDIPLPDDVDPDPPQSIDSELELAIALSERIPVGRAISHSDKAEIIRDILAVVRRTGRC